MSKPVESKHRMKPNNTISGFCKTWVWCTGYRREEETDSGLLFASFVQSFLIQYLFFQEHCEYILDSTGGCLKKRLEVPMDWMWEPSPSDLLAWCLFLILLENLKPPRNVCDRSQGWTPRGWINALWVHHNPLLPKDTSAEFSFYGTWCQDHVES